MNGITKQTRRQSYDGIRTRSGERCKLILETLGNRSMTVEEILRPQLRGAETHRAERRRSSGSRREETEQKNRKKYSRMGCGKEVST